MPDLTFITPISPTHKHLFAFTQASVQAQTVECAHLWEIDTERRGPGYIRNRLLERVTTPYVSFLDADDTLEPTFAALMLEAVRRRPDTYIYSDWLVDGKPIAAPDCAWTHGSHHLVTAVIPTEWCRLAGGFDEEMRGLEDTEFWVKLTTGGYSCCRLPVPLVHYRSNGGRAAAVHRDKAVLEALQAIIHGRYGGKKVSCCGDVIVTENKPVNEKQDGDVLAAAIWQGNREEYGRVTGRRTPRTGNGKLLWMDQRDALASPQLFQIVPQVRPDRSIPPPEPEPVIAAPVEPPPAPKGLAALEVQLMRVGLVQVPPQTAPPSALVRARLPNVNKVRRLASVAYGQTTWPLFVAPRQAYASYGDLWELARLSGFEMIYQDEADLSDPRQTFIFAAPEAIPDCTNARAHTIHWQFEFTGDYTQPTYAETVREVWSSDPAHAARTGAKYILCGSHPGLNPELTRASAFDYDITMLAYMVGRRSAIKEQLGDYRWPKNYPGHAGVERHSLLHRTRLMLHVHQHDTPALTPLRLALAAAYRMPVISEDVPDQGVYAGCVEFAPYDELVNRAHAVLSGDLALDGEGLYEFLCEEARFDKCVFEGLK